MYPIVKFKTKKNRVQTIPGETPISQESVPNRHKLSACSPLLSMDSGDMGCIVGDQTSPN